MSQLTKQALAASLKKLLDTKPLDKITIREITENCGVSRMTFYYHFKDIYDLVGWIAMEESRIQLGESFTYATWQEGMVRVFQLVKENERFLSAVYHALGKEYLERFTHPVMHRLIRGVVTEAARDITIHEEDLELITACYKYAFAGTLLDWFTGGMKRDAEELVTQLARVMQGTLDLVIQNLSRSSDPS